MGLIIEDPVLGAALVALFEEAMMPENAWRVLLDDDARPGWESTSGAVRSQLSRSRWHRGLDKIYSLLPLERHL